MQGSIRASLGLTSSVRRTLLDSFFNAVSAQLYLLYIYADNLFGEVHPLDATGERLDQWGEALLLSRNSASFAQLNITVGGIAGGRVEAGAELRSGSGNVYTVTEQTDIGADGSATALIRSLLLGVGQNLAAGDKLNFTSAIAGVFNEVTVASVAVFATDPEDDNQYRNRIIQYFQRSTWRAGGIDDYIAWALESTFVRYAWVVEEYLGVPSQVGILVLKENDEFLTDQEIAEIQNGLFSRAPVTAKPVVRNPLKQAVKFTIQIRNNNASVQESVANNLRELFARSRHHPVSYTHLTLPTTPYV